MAFNLLGLLPSAIGLASNVLSRPKKKDFTLDTKFLDRYINNLRGQRVSNQVAHFAMRPALKAIGAQSRRFDRSVDVFSSRSGAGAGVEAALRLKGNEQALGAIETAGEKAFTAQFGENRRIQERIENLELTKGRIAAEGTRDFRRAKRQSNVNIATSAVQLGANAAVGIAQARASDLATLEKAKSLDLVDDNISVKDFKQMAANRGFSSGTSFANQLMRDVGIEQAANPLDPSNLPSIEQIQAGMKSGKISLEEGRGGIQKLNAIAAETENFRNVNAVDAENITTDDVFKMVEAGEITSNQGQEFIDDIRDVQKRGEFIRNYADIVTGLKVDRTTNPKNFAGRMDTITKSNIPDPEKMRLMQAEVTNSNQLLTAFQKNIWEEFFDADSDPANLFKLMNRQGTTIKEADFIARLYGQKTKANAAQAGDIGKQSAKTGEGVAIAQIARNRINIGQGKNAQNKSYQFVNKLLNVNSIEDLTELGGNLQELQAHVHEVAQIAEIPATLPGFTEAYSISLSPDEREVYDNFNAAERVKYLKQKYEDDIMDKVFKSLKVVGFPGVTDPESVVQPAQFRGVPFNNPDGVEITRTGGGEFDDLSQFIK